MKKVLSLALALMMLLTMCVVPVMAAEPQGSESNPYYVANPMAAPSVITVPANGAVYYQYNAAVFNGWSVEAYGLSAIIVDGVVYDQMNMWGGLEVDFTFTMMSPGIVGYVNDTAEEVQVMLTHGEPMGTENNPATLETGDNAISIPASIMNYVSVYVPTANGDYTFSTEQAEDFIVSVDADGDMTDGNAVTIENGSLTLTLESYISVYVIITPVGVTGDITLTVTAPKAGTQGNPIWLDSEAVNAAYDLTGTEPLYFQVDGSLSGNKLLVECKTGGALSIELDGTAYEAKYGSLYLPLDAANWYMDLVISQASDADNTLYFSIEYAEGKQENPIKLGLGDNAVSVPAESDSYYYSYAVESDGLLIVTPAAVDGIGFLDMANADYSNYAYLQEGASSMMLPVTAGETILISLAGVMNEETWVNGAVDTVLNLTVKDLVLYDNFEDADVDGWGSDSPIAVDDVEYASGWYSAKFDVTKDWVSMYRYLDVEPNTNYEISFKAKGLLDKGFWVKFNNNWGPDLDSETVTPTTEWADYSVVLNSGEASKVILMLQHTNLGSDGQVLWFDDVVVTKAASTEEPEIPQDEDVPGNIVNNGTFNNGIDGWSSSGGTVLSWDNGTLHAAYNEDWGFVNAGTYNLKANTEYKLTFKAKCVNGGGVTPKMNKSDWSGTVVEQGMSFADEWADYEWTFTTGSDTSLMLFFQSGHPASSKQEIWLDKVVLLEVVGDEPADPEQPAGENLIVNGDFETGDISSWELKTAGNVTAEIVPGYNSDYAAKVTAEVWNSMRQSIAVEPNTDYILTAWVKDFAGMYLLIKGSDNIGQVTPGECPEWTKAELKFNSGDNSSVSVRVMACDEGTHSGIVDDIVVIKAPEEPEQPKEPSFDGHIYNGDFETGDLTNWVNLWGNNTVEFVPGMDSDNAISITTDKSWAQVRQYDIVVEPNTDYVLSGWFKNNTNLGFCVKTGDDSGDIKSYLPEETYSDWTEVTLEFNSDSQTTISVLLMSWDNGGSAIIDNVSLVEAPEVPEQPAIFDQLLVQFIGRLPSNDPKNGVFVSLSNDGVTWTDPVVYSGHGMDMWGCSNVVNPTYLGTIDVTEQAKVLTSDKFYVKVGLAAGDTSWTVLHQVRVAGTYAGATEQTEFFWEDYSNLPAFNRTGDNAADAAANVVSKVPYALSANNVYLYSCSVDHTATGLSPYYGGYYGEPENVNGHVVYGINIEPEQPTEKVYFEFLGRMPGDANGANKVQVMVSPDGETWTQAALLEGTLDDHSDSTYFKVDITKSVDLSANNLYVKMNLISYLAEWCSARQIRVTHVAVDGTETTLMHVIYDDMAIGSEEYKSGLYVDSANVQLRGTYDAAANDPSGLTMTEDHDGQDSAGLGDNYITYKIVLKEEPVVVGDANGDGSVNNRDLGLLQQYLNDFDVQPDLAACDVDGNGSVNNRDLGKLQQLLNA